ncbi:MAG TPA: HEPN domain-containing protein [Firmicutes bacterium]|nr:HEPN domain-containing protein [Bacillota bacterium]
MSMDANEAKRALISYRLQQASEALQDAAKLAEHQGTPRSIVNRSYYAMFYAVLALLLSVEKSTSKHSGAISAFDLYFVRAGLFPKHLSKSLHRAFELRQQSDYQEMVTVSPEDAHEAIRSADEFVAAVRTYLHDKGLA